MISLIAKFADSLWRSRAARAAIIAASSLGLLASIVGSVAWWRAPLAPATR
jgi:hypothetical protein